MQPSSSDLPPEDLVERALRELENDRVRAPAAHADANAPPPSQIDRYRIESRLGAGGMGTVFVAFDPERGGRIAIKVLHANLSSSQAARTRFYREAETLARLAHPGIVPILDSGVRGGATPYFVMELVEGFSLGGILERCAAQGAESARLSARDLLPEPGADKPKEADGGWYDALVRLLVKVGEALGYAHSQGVLHRDLKPSNILVTHSGEPRLIDFGIARVADASTITATGSEPGTFAYMAPELFGDTRHPASPRSDLYALGATLYCCLTFQPPFAQCGTEAMMHAVLHRDPRPPSRIDPNVPRALETICLRALEKNPKHRYATVADMTADLRRFLAHLPIVAKRPSGLVREFRRARRYRGFSATAAVASLVILAILVRLFWEQHTSNVALAAEKRKFGDARAEAAFQRARDSVTLGHWDTTLEFCTSATEQEYHDPIGISVLRVRALEGALRTPEALAELKDLAGRATGTPHEASVLLLSAVLDVNRLLAPEGRFKDLHHALELGSLSRGETDLANSMLAETAPEVLRHLESARMREPWNRTIQNQYLAMLLVCSEPEQTVAFTTTMLGQYPEDSETFVTAAFVLALQSDGDDLVERMRLIGRAVRPAERVWLEIARESTGMIHEFNRNWATNLVGRESIDELLPLEKLLALVGKVFALLSERRATPAEAVKAPGSLRFRLPPLLARAYVPLLKSIATLPLTNDTETLETRLRNGAEKLNDGFMHFMLGLSAKADPARAAEAEQHFIRAVAAPCLLIQRKVRLLALLQMQRQLLRAAPADDLRARTAATIERLLSDPKLSRIEHEFLRNVARDCGRSELAQEIELRLARLFKQR